MSNSNRSENRDHRNPNHAAAKAVSHKEVPNFSTKSLFGTAREITITHQDLLYRLRITKQGKLILNK